ncbi:hypothetical protein [Knoellia aerolata]|uniref:hypothetical protein n=1 Tax=Knoellia aerolata TaxID=442954 RepID=UPI0012ECF93B|nr:hypothetical protein [Knoellia aerolata]
MSRDLSDRSNPRKPETSARGSRSHHLETSSSAQRSEGNRRAAALGVWLLPVYALLLALSTLTHEPDHAEDFEAWSRYVTTDVFVVSHVGASILGAGLGLVGVVCAMVLMLRGPAAGTALVATALTILGNVLFTSIFAAAAYAQPAIGRAFLAEMPGAERLYDDVYGAPLLTALALGAVTFVAGALLLGRAFARTDPSLRWAGWTYGASLVVFLIAGFTVSFLQPVAAAVACVAAVVVSLRLPTLAA